MLGDSRQKHLRAVAVQREDLPHQIADLLAAALVEHQNRRSGAAQRAAEQPRRAQLQDLVQTRHQRRAVGLMQPVFERGREMR